VVTNLIYPLLRGGFVRALMVRQSLFRLLLAEPHIYYDISGDRNAHARITDVMLKFRER
jgi:hypothetical protein